jgi:hypothetical protein
MTSYGTIGNNGVKAYDVVRFDDIVYGIVRQTYDVVYDIVYDVVRAIGNNGVKAYDIVCLFNIVRQKYDIVRQTYDIVYCTYVQYRIEIIPETFNTSYKISYTISYTISNKTNFCS